MVMFVRRAGYVDMVYPHWKIVCRIGKLVFKKEWFEE